MIEMSEEKPQGGDADQQAGEGQNAIGNGNGKPSVPGENG